MHVMHQCVAAITKTACNFLIIFTIYALYYISFNICTGIIGYFLYLENFISENSEL